MADKTEGVKYVFGICNKCGFDLLENVNHDCKKKKAKLKNYTSVVERLEYNGVV